MYVFVFGLGKVAKPCQASWSVIGCNDLRVTEIPAPAVHLASRALFSLSEYAYNGSPNKLKLHRRTHHSRQQRTILRYEPNHVCNTPIAQCVPW